MRTPARTLALGVAIATSAFAPVDGSGQELPEAAIEALLRHLAGEPARVGRMVVELDAFPDRALARRTAERLGLEAGLNEDLVSCDLAKERCEIRGGERLIRLLDLRVLQPGRELELRIVASGEWVREDPPAARLFPVLRRIRLSNREGWRVTRDEVQLRG